MSQTENDSQTYLFNVKGVKKTYNLVEDPEIKNGDLIFEMLRYEQDDRISSSILYQKLLGQYQKQIFEPEMMQFKDMNAFL